MLVVLWPAFRGVFLLDWRWLWGVKSGFRGENEANRTHFFGVFLGLCGLFSVNVMGSIEKFFIASVSGRLGRRTRLWFRRSRGVFGSEMVIGAMVQFSWDQRYQMKMSFRAWWLVNGSFG
jgi:hypothetical protein